VEFGSLRGVRKEPTLRFHVLHTFAVRMAACELACEVSDEAVNGDAVAAAATRFFIFLRFFILKRLRKFPGSLHARIGSSGVELLDCEAKGGKEGVEEKASEAIK
jgi:hypothetical protein